jgi:hypothetical protein
MKQIAKSLLLVLTAIALFVSCSAKSPIVGKWQEVGGDNETVEFFKGGKASLVSHGKTLAAKYSLADDGRLQLELAGIGETARPVTILASISGGELRLTDPTGKLSTYQRSK